MLTPFDFGGVNDGVTDNAAAFTQMFANGRHFFIPEGVWASSAAMKPLSGSVIDATKRSEFLAIGPATASGFVIRMDTATPSEAVTVRNLRMNGNKNGRTGSPTGNGFYIRASGCVFEGVECFDWPNAGWLLGGQQVPCDSNILRDCIANDNGKTGVSQHSATSTLIDHLRARDNGGENVTIDGPSFNCIMRSSRIGPAKGGCGSVGWDGGNGSLLFGNIFDLEGSTEAPEGSRNAICVNATFATTNDIGMVGNIILNASEAGIRLKDKTSIGGYAVGRALVAANVLRGNGADIVAETDVGPVQMGANHARTINII